MAKLSDREIKNLQMPTKNDKFISDGSNLYLRLTTKGKKIFYYIYKNQGKVIKKSLGEYPIISLKGARELFLDHRIGSGVSLVYKSNVTLIKELKEIVKWWSNFIVKKLHIV